MILTTALGHLSDACCRSTSRVCLALDQSSRGRRGEKAAREVYRILRWCCYSSAWQPRLRSGTLETWRQIMQCQYQVSPHWSRALSDSRSDSMQLTPAMTVAEYTSRGPKRRASWLELHRRKSLCGGWQTQEPHEFSHRLQASLVDGSA